MNGRLQARLLCGAAVVGLLGAASAAQAADADFSIPAQPLASALSSFSEQSGRPVLYRPEIATSKSSPGAAGEVEAEVALNQLLAGTGLTWKQDGDTFLIMKADADPQPGSAVGDGAEGTVEALIVTAQKREEDIQDVPIAISAFTQEDLERAQVAGGPDLMTQVPNMTFTKTNFSSYSIQIRGIGTQAISATTDPAVAVAFNNTPFVRNRFFEQEFYDVERVEVLRGPQGTLYGRNATAGVVNIISAKPKFRYEAKLSADVANYDSTRLEGMVNIPLVEDIAALRLAGAWTKRDGFVTNEITGNPIDGRDLWSGRASLAIEPNDRLRADLIYEHFEEDDDRLRSGKQLCKKDVVTHAGNIVVPPEGFQTGGAFGVQTYLSQGCDAASLYSDDSFQTPNGFSLPFFGPLGNLGAPVSQDQDPYVGQTQSRDLRVIESTVDPQYRAKTDVAELQIRYELSDTLSLQSETAYSYDTIFSLQDYNRFNTKPGAFDPDLGLAQRDGLLTPDGVFCDPQLGCSNRLVLVDLSTAKSQQFSQELRLSSEFEGAFNFSLGANFLRYDTEDKYYIFINSLSLFAAQAWGTQADNTYVPGLTDNTDCQPDLLQADLGGAYQITSCIYLDPNPIGSLNDKGRNYFLSRNPYRLISYAAFGELYYSPTPNLKVTAGLRWTVDKKNAPRIPSWLLASDAVGPYPVDAIVDQEWREPSGRLTVDWKPDLSFTDETLLYGSYAHGYKAGGANPPPLVFANYGGGADNDLIVGVVSGHSQTFDPEFVDAFEVGTKNTLLDGRMTLNLAAFYYDYQGYQISQILDRSAINSNYDAEVWGAELEVNWRPLDQLRLAFRGGYQDTKVADGQGAIDLIDRTAGDPQWTVIRPFPTVPSNCIVPTSWFDQFPDYIYIGSYFGGSGAGPCVNAYYAGQNIGFDPSTVPNNGAGVTKDLSGNELPNAPHFTATLSADYTAPLPNDWLATLHADFYYQSEAWTRIFNMEGYDKLKAYNNINLAAIFTNEDRGWTIMAYVKNVLDRDSITGAFLNSDDTGLTTNVFLTEPRLYGLRVTKNWSGGGLLGSFGARRAGPYPLSVEIGGGVSRLTADDDVFAPGWTRTLELETPYPVYPQNQDRDWGDDREVKVTYRPEHWSGWRISLDARTGRANASAYAEERGELPEVCIIPGFCQVNRLFGGFAWGTNENRDSDRYTIADFQVGRDVGIGDWLSASAVSVGLRYAEFETKSQVELHSAPDHYLRPDDPLKYERDWHSFDEHWQAERSFEGAGPAIAWEASSRLLGSEETGWMNLDWSLGAGVLFGSQRVSSEQQAIASHTTGTILEELFGGVETTETAPAVITRRDTSRRVSVPNLSGSVGLSYDVDRLKISTGYRWERFFDAIDGGVTERKEYDRTIDGPYIRISVGFGG